MSSSVCGVKNVGPEQLREWLDQGKATVVDVREPDEFGSDRIDGARLLPLVHVCRESVPVEPGVVTVLSCRSGGRSNMAAERLIADGASDVVQLDGGLSAWKDAGFPTVGQPTGAISVMRQVQIVVGGGVLLTVLLGAFVWPWWLAIAGFFGAGLLFAGLTGTCGLAMILKKMPWNRPARDSRAQHAECCK